MGHIPVLVALRDGWADTHRDFARFAKVQLPPMAQMLDRMERDGRWPQQAHPIDRARQVAIAERLLGVLDGNREALSGFTDEEEEQLIGLLARLIANLDRMATPGTSSSQP